MRISLGLKNGESAVILNPDFKAFYDMPRSFILPCNRAEKVCWSRGLDKVSYLEPIYFDPVKKEGLKGYLQLTTFPILDRSFVLKFSVFLLFGFIIQAFGLLSALENCANLVKESLSRWTLRLGSINQKEKPMADAPFLEMVPAETAINNLPEELIRLEEKIENESKFRAQLSIIREVGHDIGTPISQVGRYWGMLVQDLKTKGIDCGGDGAGIDRALSRARDLVENFQTFNKSVKELIFIQDGQKLTDEIAVILKDLDVALELSEKNIQIIFLPEKINAKLLIPKTDLYRIVENIVRNSFEAITSRRSKAPFIKVTLEDRDERIFLKVYDNGPGLKQELKDEIFNPDFTTKKLRGTGLGLAFVKDKCNELGALVMSETIEVGACFSISFKKLDFSKVVENGTVSNLSC